MKILRKAGEERGAIALMTVAFMMMLGVMAILFVWSLGVITGAYNTLYIANQSAAVAAATATLPSDGASGQISYNCFNGGMGKELCATGFPRRLPAVLAARAVMEKSLEKRPFGLEFGRNVTMHPPGFDHFDRSESGIYAYNVSRPAGEIKRAMERTGQDCVISPGSDWGVVPDAFEGSDEEIHCWQVTERGVKFPKKFNSGVLVKSTADLNVFNCGFSFCRTELTVLSAATQEQVSAPEDVEFYYFYNPRD